MSETGPSGGGDGTAVPVQARGILFAHGAIAEGMVDAVRAISGCAPEALEWVSNQDGDPAFLGERLATLGNPRRTIVFTDLRASSCSVMAGAALRDGHVAAVVQGVNLAILLDFVFHRTLPIPELVDRLVRTGRAAVEAIQIAPHAGPRP